MWGIDWRRTRTVIDRRIFKGRAGVNCGASESLVWWGTAGVAFSMFTSRWPWWWRCSPWCWNSRRHSGPHSCFVLLICVLQARFRVEFYLKEFNLKEHLVKWLQEASEKQRQNTQGFFYFFYLFWYLPFNYTNLFTQIVNCLIFWDSLLGFNE